MKGNIKIWGSLALVLTLASIIFYNFDDNTKKNISYLTLSNIQTLSQNESGSDPKGCHVVNGSCKVTVGGKTYYGSWNECNSDSDCPSCKSICVTGIQI